MSYKFTSLVEIHCKPERGGGAYLMQLRIVYRPGRLPHAPSNVCNSG
jgi:hypothetical protein